MTTTVEDLRQQRATQVAEGETQLRELYTAVVRKAADDKPLTKGDLETAAEASEMLGLPADCFDTDVEAMRRSDALGRSLTELERLQPGERAQLDALRDELQSLEYRAVEIRRQQREIGGRGMSRAAYRQQIHDLRCAHRHLWPKSEATA